MNTTNISELCIDLLIDASGSMFPRRNIVISGLNEFIQEQKKNLQEGTKCLVSLYFFNTEIKTVFEEQDISTVENIDNNDYNPNGCTALYDAFGDCLLKIKNYPNHLQKPKRILLVMTDGLENSSIRITSTSLNNLIEETKKDVKIIYMGSNQDAITNGQFLGADRNASLQYRDELLGEALRSTTQAIGRVVSGQSDTVIYTQQERDYSC